VEPVSGLHRSPGLHVHAPAQRLLRFWSRQLLFLNVVLCALVSLLYGGLDLRGYGEEYLARTADFWLENGWPSVPGLENVLLPGLAAVFARGWTAAGFEFTQTTFILVAAAPYALFIYGLSAYVKRAHGGLLPVAAAIALYTSGMIPYMTSWGGSVDGLSYLSMLPVFIWPNSLLVYAAAAVLQGLNHYAGLIALVLFAFVWHTLRALDHEEARAATKYWLTTFAPRAILTGAMLLGFLWFWESRYPEVAEVRQAIVAEKWREPGAVLLEVIGPFPWTLLSTLKLALIPVVVLMCAPHPRKGARAAVLAAPFLAAAALTFVWVDVTRMATMLVIPAWLATVRAAGGDLVLPPDRRRRLRRLMLATALLNLLIPNYYVNNGVIQVPPAKPIQSLISTVVGD
jgi:hypothetical protein